jgi:hypothetical protein
MDPITTAVLATLPALASDVVKSSVKDAYEGLKSVIQRKWGATSPIAKSIDALQANPKSNAQAAVLSENVTGTRATSDPEVMKAVSKLVDELKKEGLGGEAIAAITIKITGGTVQGVVGAENVSIDAMNFGVTPTRPKT